MPAGATFFCAVCGQLAATVTVDSAVLIQTGFMGKTTEAITPELSATISHLLNQGNVRQLYELNQLWAPFYCPECNQTYCRGHWVIIPQFDDDFPGWYDCAYGTCPHNHRRLIDD